ncbi:transglutaminase 5, like [Aplochiton taeniatus]
MEDLKIQCVNLEQKSNQERHQTQAFDRSNLLVVRRGTPFRVNLLLKGRPFNPQTDTLVFKALLGRLYVTIPVTFSSDVLPTKWSAIFDPQGVNANAPSIFLSPPASACVGLYNLQLLVFTQSRQRGYVVGDFILLCNPWCQEDAVYIPFVDQREEYVLNDSGILYMGTAKNMVSRPWHFDQFEPMILEICLKLLQVSPNHFKDPNKDFLRHSDPVYISRVVSAMINCEDDKGVLMGNWTGNYSDGTLPSNWAGSGDILKQWAKSGCSPVKYGQCWVFAAVMCTVMRALGIPSRVVSNFNSAHDTNGNLVIEEFYSETGVKLPINKDSIWNFHVWVECWMTRPDLAAGLDGWQVLDPTPQEKSGGVFCCGPAPVKAVRDRRVDLPFDVPFVYAEMNADVRVMVVKQGRVVSSRTDSSRVGSLLCTKAIGSAWPQNITVDYKAIKKSAGSSVSSSGLTVSLSLQKTPVAGESIFFTVTVTNKEDVAKVIKQHVNAQAKVYSHAPLGTLWEAHSTVSLAPLEVKVLQHLIPPGQYEMVVGDDLINLAVVLKDSSNQESVLACEEFNIASPQLSIKLSDKSIVCSKQHTGVVVVTNPFSVPISGLLTVGGTGLIQGKLQSRVPPIPPGGGVERMFRFTSSMAGTKMLQASLTLRNVPLVIRGFKMVSVSTG